MLYLVLSYVKTFLKLSFNDFFDEYIIIIFDVKVKYLYLFARFFFDKLSYNGVKLLFIMLILLLYYITFELKYIIYYKVK